MSRRRALTAAATALCCALAAACQDSPAPDGTAAPAPRDNAPGEVWSVGLNDTGQLGRKAEDMDVALAPVLAPGGTGPLREVTAVAAGQRHSLALTTDGRVYAWGANTNGQLGNGTGRPSALPIAVRAPDGAPGELRDVTAIAAAGGFSMALRRDGKVVTWGSGSNGQRGIGTFTAPKLPTTVRAANGRGPLTGVTAIAAGDHNGLAVVGNGGVLSWGGNLAGLLGAPGIRRRALPAPVPGVNGQGRLNSITSLSVGSKHVLALTGDGRVLSWGKNDRGQLGDGGQNGRMTPAPVNDASGNAPLGGVASISAGGKHSYALLRDGTVLAWGDNLSGQLGNASTAPSPRPVPVAGAHTAQLRGVGQVEAGQGYGLAILAGGSALSWGAAGKGQLGSGNRLTRSRPGPLVMAHGARTGTFVAVAAGDRHLIVLMRPRTQ